MPAGANGCNKFQIPCSEPKRRWNEARPGFFTNATVFRCERKTTYLPEARICPRALCSIPDIRERGRVDQVSETRRIWDGPFGERFTVGLSSRIAVRFQNGGLEVSPKTQPEVEIR
jgi:ribosomal protein L34E